MKKSCDQNPRLSSDELAAYAAAFNLLGSCYRLAPDREELVSMLGIFKFSDWMNTWPAIIPEEQHKTMAILSTCAADQLKEEWNLLFVGPAASPAPPWGSVYLDPERLLQGESTQKLNAFLKREKLELKTECREPSDHIGLLLFQAAFLARQERETALFELLELHLCTWLPLYLQQLERTQASDFYTALTRLTFITAESILDS